MINSEPKEVAKGIWQQGFEHSFTGGISLYSVVSGGQFLLVDTGEANSDATEALASKLHGIGSSANVRAFITHHHLDHSGNVQPLLDAGVPVHAGPQSPLPKADTDDFVRICGLNPTEDNSRFWGFILISKRNDMPIESMNIVDEWRSITVGDRSFQVIPTPGHTSGHCDLYERETGYVFTGDHIINGIIPNVDAAELDAHDMSSAIKSLDTISAICPEAMFPSHLSPVFGQVETMRLIDKIKTNYLSFIERVLRALSRDGGQTPLELKVRAFPNSASYRDNPRLEGIMLGKVLAAAEYLAETGEAKRHVDEQGTAWYSL